MEFVAGTDLDHLIHGGSLTPAQALELTLQVCTALQYAHTRGVIHRDIKPANVLVDADGQAKLADFGLARPEAEDSGHFTRTQTVMGTPAYMAPEQRQGHSDHRADIYALGVLLYEMLTGKRPEGIFAPVSAKAAVDPRLDAVVHKAMQHNPERRYKEVAEMKADVDRIRTKPRRATAEPARSSKRVLANKPPAPPNANRLPIRADAVSTESQTLADVDGRGTGGRSGL